MTSIANLVLSIVDTPYFLLISLKETHIKILMSFFAVSLKTAFLMSVLRHGKSVNKQKGKTIERTAKLPEKNAVVGDFSMEGGNH